MNLRHLKTTEETFFQSLVELAAHPSTPILTKPPIQSTADTQFLEEEGLTILSQLPILLRDPQAIITTIKPGEGFTHRKVLDIIDSFEKLKKELLTEKTKLDNHIKKNPQHNKHLDTLSVLLTNELDWFKTLRNDYFGEPLQLQSLKKTGKHSITMTKEDWEKWQEIPPLTHNLTKLKSQLLHTLKQDRPPILQAIVSYNNKYEETLSLNCQKLLKQAETERDKAIDSISTDDKYLDPDQLKKIIKEKFAHRHIADKDLEDILACNKHSINYLKKHFVSKEVQPYIDLLNYATCQKRIKVFEKRLAQLPHQPSSQLASIHNTIKISQLLSQPATNKEAEINRLYSIQSILKNSSHSLEFRIRFNQLVSAYGENKGFIPTSTIGRVRHRFGKQSSITRNCKKELAKGLNSTQLFNREILGKENALANWLTAIKAKDLYSNKQLKKHFNELVFWNFKSQNDVLTIYNHLSEFRPSFVKPLQKRNAHFRQIYFYYLFKSSPGSFNKKYANKLSSSDIVAILKDHQLDTTLLKYFFSDKNNYIKRLPLYDLVTLASLDSSEINRYLCDPKKTAWSKLKNRLIHIVNTGITDESRYDFNHLMQNYDIISACDFSTKQLEFLLSLKDKNITFLLLDIDKYRIKLRKNFKQIVTDLDNPNVMDLIALKKLKFFLKEEHTGLLNKLLQHYPTLSLALQRIIRSYGLRNLSEETTKLILHAMQKAGTSTKTETSTGAKNSNLSKQGKSPPTTTPTDSTLTENPQEAQNAQVPHPKNRH